VSLPCPRILNPLNSIQQGPYTSLIKFIMGGPKSTLELSRNFVRSAIKVVLTEIFVSWQAVQNSGYRGNEFNQRKL
jgi:hypothetical protein